MFLKKKGERSVLYRAFWCLVFYSTVSISRVLEFVMYSIRSVLFIIIDTRKS